MGLLSGHGQDDHRQAAGSAGHTKASALELERRGGCKSSCKDEKMQAELPDDAYKVCGGSVRYL